MRYGTRVFEDTQLLGTSWSFDHEKLPWTITMEVDVDWLLATLGQKARRNKSKKTRMTGIVVKVKPV